MPGPFGINNVVQNQPGGDLGRRVRDLERAMQQMMAARTLENASIGQGGIRTVNFDGTSFVDPGTTGNYFGADGLVINDVYLRGGIIGNDALTSPVAPASAHADAQSFTLSTSMAAKATATVTVPAGFTKALVIAVSQVGARNSTTGLDTLSVGIAINGVTTPGWAANTDAAATSTIHPVVSATAAGTALLTGLGGSFTVQARASSGLAAWSSDVYNTANIDAIALFLR